MGRKFRGQVPSKEWLYEKFVVEGKSRAEIAKEVGCASSTVNVWLWSLGITKTKPYTPELLYKLHVEERKSATEIAKELGVTDDTIIYQLKINGIPYTPNIVLKDRLSKYTKEWLLERYTNSRESISSLALKEGLKRSTLADLVKYHGLEIKHFSETLPARLDNLLRTWTYRNLRPEIILEKQFCERCGSEELLELHHRVTLKTMVRKAVKLTGKDPRTDKGTEYIFEWIKENEPLFKDKNNLLVLCHDCHILEHTSKTIRSQAPKGEGSTTIETSSGSEAKRAC